MVARPQLQSALPRTEGTHTLKGPESAVAVYRDRWGIPHLKARASADAFFAQGYVHAQDRLWQMDAARRRMLGQWAEWVGPAGVDADILARRLDVAGASQRDFAALTAESRAMLESYAAGVNACLAEGTPLPLEYSVLPGRPEPWRAWHCIAVMRQRGYLMGSIWFKLWRAAALAAIDPVDVTKLRYADGGSDLVCIPPGVEGERLVASLRDLAPSIAAVAKLAGVDATGGGSNNWAVAPSRTQAGRPLLAGDPHRVFEMPSMYAQMHLACDDFDAIGLTVPGVPAFPHFAHNGHVAWCVTHAFVDIHDLFVEQFEPGSATRYLFRGTWQTASRRTETIFVRDAAAIETEVVETHHGPIIAGNPADGTALALRSIQFCQLDRSIDCLLPMLSAHTVDQLFEATRQWGLIDHNLVAADTTGRIGHLVRAIVPKRSRLNGWLPVPGWTGDHEWAGMIPWEDMPRTFDPPRGYLVTANNRIVADAAGEQHYFCVDCHPAYRARRIEDLLAGLPAAGFDDMERIHADDRSLTAPIFQRRLAALELGGASAQLRDLIVAWDGRVAADSIAAAAYTALRWDLTRILAERSGLAGVAANALLAVPPVVVPVNQLWWALPDLLRADDAALLKGTTWDAALAHALQRTAATFEPKPWRELHCVRMAHPLSPAFPQLAASLDPPGAGVGGDNDTVMVNGCYAGTGLAAAYGAVARYVFDVGRWDNCRWIVFHGASGHPDSPHFADQHALWAKCRLVPMLYDWTTIAGESRCLTLIPA